MERADLYIKSGVAIAGGALSYLVGLMGVFLICLIVLMVADFITGVLASKYTGRAIKSDIGRKGLIRKTYVLILVMSVYLFEFMVGSQLSGYDIAIVTQIEQLGLQGITGSGIAFLYCVTELVSIVENGDKMGHRLPAPARVFFEAASKYLSGTEEKQL